MNIIESRIILIILPISHPSTSKVLNETVSLLNFFIVNIQYDLWGGGTGFLISGIPKNFSMISEIPLEILAIPIPGPFGLFSSFCLNLINKWVEFRINGLKTRHYRNSEVKTHGFPIPKQF